MPICVQEGDVIKPLNGTSLKMGDEVAFTTDGIIFKKGFFGQWIIVKRSKKSSKYYPIFPVGNFIYCNNYISDFYAEASSTTATDSGSSEYTESFENNSVTEVQVSYGFIIRYLFFI